MSMEKYLNKIQSKESVGGFAIDSIPEDEKKGKKIIRTVYPESKEFIFKRAMIDLDGTIHKYSKGIEDGSLYDNPFNGAKETITWLKKQGFEIVIFTSRVSRENALEMGYDLEEQFRIIESWLENNNIYFDRITAEKLPADFYIDDKAIFIKDGNWNEVTNIIKERI